MEVDPVSSVQNQGSQAVAQRQKLNDMQEKYLFALKAMEVVENIVKKATS